MTSNSSNCPYSWVPTPENIPPKFSDCNSAKILYKISAGKHQNSLYNDSDIYNAVLGAFESFGTPPRDEVIAWARGTSSFKDTLSKVFYTSGDCRNEICPLEGWRGDPDIAGVGMLVVYVAQAVLVTIYISALLIIRSDERRKPGNRRRWPSIARTLLAIQHSTTAFLNASSVFAIAMLFASIMSVAQQNGNSISTRSIYLLMPCNSVLPVALLQFAASKLLRRNRGRLYLWALILLLLITVLTVSFVRPLSLSLDNSKYDQYLWELMCLDQGELEPLLWFPLPLISSLLAGVAMHLISSIFMVLRRKPLSPGYARLARRFWWIAFLSAYLAMCLCLGFFIKFQMHRNRIGGSDNEDTEWSFGQVLAVTTWVPVIVEFAYVWWETPVEALNGRLMDPYEVKDMSKKTEAFEANRRETI